MEKESDSSRIALLGFRLVVLISGLIAISFGRSAQSQGILWHTGRNARTGTETSTPTISWLIDGVVLFLVGIFPWNWLGRRLKR